MWQVQVKCGNTTSVMRDELRSSSLPGYCKVHMVKDASVGSNTNIYCGVGGDSDRAKDKWAHVAVVKDDDYVYQYINGVFDIKLACSLFESSPQTLTGYFKMGENGTSCPAWIQDFRIYDNCLSAKEIEILARGLVVHYPLAAPGQENLCRNSATLISGGGSYSSGTWRNSGTGSCIYNTNMSSGAPFLKGVIITPSKANVGMGFCQDAAPINAGNITFSCWVKAPVGGTIRLQPFWKSGAAGMSPPSGSHSNQWNTNGEWQHIYTSYSPTVDYDSTSIAYVYYETPNIGETCEVCGLKLEYGLTVTSWMPNSADDEYAALGFNDGIEYDVSGYGHNGIKTGTFKYSADTPKYNTCTVFSGNNHIAVGRLIIKDELTYNWWAYSDNWGGSLGGSMMSSVEGGGMGHQNAGSTYLWLLLGTGETSNNYGNGYQMPTPSAGWHMFTETWDGFSFKVYIDGVLKFTDTRYTTKTPVWYGATGNWLFLGGESSSSATTPSDHFIGKLSDVRIYATALSPNAIKELFHTGQTLTNTGVLMSNEITET